MPKTRKERLQEYRREMRLHVRQVWRREVSFLAAVKAMVEDTRHVARRVLRGEQPAGRRRAKQYLQQGVQAYNAGRYDRAQALFDNAINADDHFALAWVYMGNARYKMSRLTEAVQAWQKALEVEPGSKGAEMAREKLERVVHGREGAADAYKEQLRSR